MTNDAQEDTDGINGTCVRGTLEGRRPGVTGRTQRTTAFHQVGGCMVRTVVMRLSTEVTMLTPSVAQEIARETSAVIGFNVLITDNDGIVIGSGDVDRIGSFHEASLEVVRTLRPTSHGPDAAVQLVGVQPGVTLPIMLNREPVGTVGITGEPDQVERFGRLVRHQTEILLRESLLLRSRLLRKSAIEDLIRDLAHYDPQVTEPDFIAFKASELGYDLRLTRAVVVIDVDVAGNPSHVDAHGDDPLAPEPTTLQAAILRTAHRAFPDAQDLIGTTASGRFVVLHRLPATAPAWDGPCNVAEDPPRRLLVTCRALASDLTSSSVTCRIGVGGYATSVSGLHDSYRDATNTLYLMRRLGRHDRVAHIDDVRVPDLLATVPPAARNRYVRAVAGPLPDHAEWRTIRNTIAAWCESGFNLVRAAAALHVHRNTLVYRLDKIEKQLGVAIRDPRAGIRLYLACLVDEIDEDR
ncbi:sugar diacid recognition domain-containing protein [Pseudofrankia sp. BMG5.36]|uniref:CdaR family transcriptional regulator n=1 Tax=Pseudofrankia sp. BMG5.36 TaxID=1834512 RepID=UPI0018E2E653|nr:sugar diacid recognition domain-containing protein [Pseudofrankia sp. BMG5.36]